MRLLDLYYRVLGTTGLNVMDLNSLKAAVSNCMADLTSRGYKIFVEKHLSDFVKTVESLEKTEILSPTEDQKNNAKQFNSNNEYKEGDIVRIGDSYFVYYIKETTESAIEQYNNMIILPAPTDIRKIVYLRLFFGQDAAVAERLSLSNPRVQCKYLDGQFRSLIPEYKAVFYIKNDKIYIEWNNETRPELKEISLGYYKKLYCPEDFPSDPDKASEMEKVIIDIRPEFEDALVLYAAYFYTARYLKDTDKINLTLSNYKYYVEDIIHELSYEDEFNEEDTVIKVEED